VPAGSAQAAGAAAARQAEAAAALASAGAGVRRRPARPLHRLPGAASQEADPGVVMLRSAGRDLPPASFPGLVDFFLENSSEFLASSSSSPSLTLFLFSFGLLQPTGHGHSIN